MLFDWEYEKKQNIVRLVQEGEKFIESSNRPYLTRCDRFEHRVREIAHTLPTTSNNFMLSTKIMRNDAKRGSKNASCCADNLEGNQVKDVK